MFRIVSVFIPLSLSLCRRLAASLCERLIGCWLSVGFFDLTLVRVFILWDVGCVCWLFVSFESVVVTIVICCVVLDERLLCVAVLFLRRRRCWYMVGMSMCLLNVALLVLCQASLNCLARRVFACPKYLCVL